MCEQEYFDEDPLEEDIDELGHDSPTAYHTCQRCGHEYHEDLSFCPQCSQQGEPAHSLPSWAVIIALIALAAFVFLVLSFL